MALLALAGANFFNGWFPSPTYAVAQGLAQVSAAQGSEIFGGVAQVGEFQVDDGRDPAFVEEELAGVAADKTGGARRFGQVSLQPLQGEFDQGLGASL